MTRRILTSAVLATLALSACGGLSNLQSGSDGGSADSADSGDSEGGGTLNLDTDGPTVCLDKALEKLGPDAMVNEIESHFQVSSEIDPPLIENDSTPAAGELFICKAYYQDPSDPVKLLAITMDTDTGEFGEPEPVEISFSGDAAEFDLNDYVIKASDVDTSIIQPKLDEKAPALDKKYSLWQWSTVRLQAPGSFSDVHSFDVGAEGRLAANDLNESGYLTFALDGTVLNDSLE